MSDSLEPLCRMLDYRFNDPALLEEAVTHRSVSDRNNERLEFLGDSVLNFVIADELFRRQPRDSEGGLSRLRASLVNRETLASIARQLDLGRHLRLGSGERKSGGRRRDSILSDALEGVLGAVYLDGGFARCHALIVRLFAERLEHLPDASELKDPKTRLQEYLQSARLSLPTYEVLEIAGKAHDQTFRVECRVPEVDTVTVGEAGSRRRAEQRGAEAMLRTLEAGKQEDSQ
ncbi:ribonuclease III [Aquisalimonas lutea]|uniref:ribonuclease III n=1 Tax=Aquisalimonas lutea TaxID=1327750 RepID=UPI0025B43CCE|nr:ribonuclease III [Aquisalimonas lutea]MDN3518560.1 ribonuclease III [Aquisalimonas lutea]